jgi:hypothetical protein
VFSRWLISTSTSSGRRLFSGSSWQFSFPVAHVESVFRNICREFLSTYPAVYYSLIILSLDSVCIVWATGIITKQRIGPNKKECGGAFGCGAALQAAGSRVPFPMVSLKIFMVLSLWPHCGPGFDSTSNRNKYQGYLLVDNGGGRFVGLTTLPHSYAD